MLSNRSVTPPQRQSRVQKLLDAGAHSAVKDLYRQAGKSQNTHDSYLRAINHYRDVWGGLLPASSKQISDYIVRYAEDVKVSTTRLRLAALSKWHQSQGIYDPTRAPEVKEVLKGIAKVHQSQQKQALPLTYDHLKVMVARLEKDKMTAIAEQNHGEILRAHRDLALLLVGFWQGFRSDELSRIEADNVTLQVGRSIAIFLPYSKTDTKAKGRTYTLKALRAYCPVDAYQRWIEVSCIRQGPVFRNISRWGQIANGGINKRSIEHVLNRVADGLFSPGTKFSTHSLRRGFASWASDQGWDMKSLCDHVGWKSFETASRYMPIKKSFGDLDLEPPKRDLISENGSPGLVEGTTLFAQPCKIDDNE